MIDLKQKILLAVSEDLQQIEEALVRNLNPYLDLVRDTAAHILFAGGKRLRPLLMVLSARINGYAGDFDKTLSTVFEYLHAATLLHDDVVDGASVRRGRPVAHSVFGNPTTVLVGDFLLARSLSIAAQTGRAEVIRIIAEITENMSQGEIHQLLRKGCLDLSEEEYVEVIRRKTAVLIQGACRVGAVIADSPDPLARAMTDYGLHIGMAFQMADDLLDYTADPQVLGKAVGADLREGKLTLPVIHCLKRADAGDREIMERVIRNEDFSAHDFNTFKNMLERYGSLAYAKSSAGRHVERAKEAIEAFPASQVRQTLSHIADYALARSF